MLSYLPSEFKWPESLAHWPVVSAEMIRDDLLEDGTGKHHYAFGLVDAITYSSGEQERFVRLYRRQWPQWEKWACSKHLQGLSELGLENGISDFKDLNDRMYKKTGMVVVGVNGLLKTHDFFELLSHGIFPVTWWLRKETELDYIVEPDLFHDLVGHVPLLMVREVADFMRCFGRQGLIAVQNQEDMVQLGAVYWFTAEFGLIYENEALKVWGAGILSSKNEMAWSMSNQSKKSPFRWDRAGSMSYRIDQMQPLYFVLDDWSDLKNLNLTHL